jgi:hypothetical protein
VYDRRYDGKVLTFEASGGLIRSSLVLQDRETDSYWPIMSGQSIQGELSGTPMKKMAVNRKMTWSDWVDMHPETLVLSVNGIEDQADTYSNYFQSKRGFRNTKAKDKRLKTKAPIYAFRLKGKPYAASYNDIVGGKQFKLGGQVAYLYRSPYFGLHDSTLAYIADADAGCPFDASKVRLGGCGEPLEGFDTFWYNWSLNNPKSELLK